LEIAFYDESAIVNQAILMDDVEDLSVDVDQTRGDKEGAGGE
jgi:hypothetical protein